METVDERFIKQKSRQQLQEDFGEHYDLFIEALLAEVPVIGALMHEVPSEQELRQRVYTYFRRRFGIDVASKHREVFVRAIRGLWKEFEQQRREKQRPGRRPGLRARVQAIRKRIGL